MRPVCFRGKTIPVWLICLLIVPLTVSVVYAASVTTTNYQDLSGEVVTIDTELTPGMVGLAIEDSALSAAGLVQGTPVVMATSPGSAAQTDTVVGNYVYSYTLTIATTNADQEYSVELLRDGTEVDTLYVAQDAAGTSGFLVTCTWDTGLTTLTGTDIYQIKVVKV